jgi:hypothetical protein
MSRLESKAKPIIGPLMHDLSYALDSSQQETVSVWAIKTAIVLEAINRRTRLTCYTQHECEQLRLHSSIPTRSLGWLGRFAASGLVATGTDIWLDIGGVSRAAHGCVTTIVVGHLALQFLTVHFPAKYDGEPLSINCLDGPWNDLLVDLWPIRNSAAWPPKLSFTNGGARPYISLRDRWKYGKAV